MVESGSVSALRGGNRSRIFRLIAERRSISRIEIADATGLKPPSVTRIVRELIEYGLVDDEPESQASVKLGRRRTGLYVKPDGAYVLGFAMNASGMSVGLSGADGILIDQKRIEGAKRLDSGQTLAALSTAANNLIDVHVCDRKLVLGAAVACAGEVDSETGYLHASMAMGWNNVAVGQILTERLGVPVQLDNLNISLLEAARLGWLEPENLLDSSNAVLVRVSNGIIGSSVLVNGIVLRNAQSRPSWFGHHPVRGGTQQCFCGEVGCLNTVASAPAILTAFDKGNARAEFTASDFVKNESRIRQLVRQAEAGNGDAALVLQEAGEVLGRFLVATVCSFGAEVIQIAGFVGRSDAYMKGVRQGFEGWASGQVAHNVSIVANAMPLVESAAHVALDRHVYSSELDVEKLSRAAMGAGSQKGSVNAA